jgi:DUF4097 and DUF4098 domain-containing protein YvlB
VHKIIIALLLTTLPLAAGASECRYSAPRNADLDAAGLSGLLLKLGSTDLDIQSVSGLNKVEVRGTACASDASWLKDVQLDANRSGDRATVVAQNNRHDNTFTLFGSTYAYLKLQVRVPASLAINVETGSGDVKATSLASLDFNSGSGDLQADHIAGALTLKLGSADVKAQQVGNVDLRETGSGDVRVDGVRGDVKADHSGSGELNFSNVSGGVNVGATGSGDVTFNNIGRDAKVGSTGSGDVNANGVGGNFTVGASGSGDVHYTNVKGQVSVPKRSDD